MVDRVGFYSAVFDTAKSLGANDVQAHLAASQASQETGFGQHVVGNNYFGVKAGTAYAGPTVDAATHEVVDGQSVGITDRFRSYSDLKDSVAGYMNFMANNFPSSWNATSFSDAVKGLVSGEFGKYATDPNYTDKVENIAGKYGQYAYAAAPENVPVPYGPNDDPFADSLQAQSIDGLSGVLNPAVPGEVVSAPIPEARPALTSTLDNYSDLAAAGPMAITQNLPASASLGTPADLSASSDVAMGAPTGEVSRGILSAAASPVNSGWSNMAAAGPMGILSNVPATAENWASLGLEASAKATPVDNASVADRMGVAPDFDVSRFGDVQPQNFDMARFGTPSAVETAAFSTPTQINQGLSVPASGLVAGNPALGASASVPLSASLFSPAVQPAASQIAASNNSFSDLAAAGPFAAPMSVTPTGVLSANPSLAASAAIPSQTVAAAGILSPEHQQIAANANAALADMQTAARPSTTVAAVSNPVSSFSDLAAAGPVNSGILSSYTETPQVTPAAQAIADVTANGLSPAAIAGYQDLANSGYLGGITNLSGNTLVGPTGVATSNVPTIETPTFNTVAAETTPSSTTTIDGPTNTPAVEQQQQAKVNAVTSNTPALSGQFPSAPAKSGMLGGAINKGSLTGGILGGLVAGPVGGILGALAGNQINASGGLTGLLGGQPMSINTVPGTLANISGIYNGAMPAGTQTVASNGSTITAQPGGWTTVENKYGVTESVSPWGGYAGYFGPDPNKPDAGAGDNAGYDSPGLF